MRGCEPCGVVVLGESNSLEDGCCCAKPVNVDTPLSGAPEKCGQAQLAGACVDMVWCHLLFGLAAQYIMVLDSISRW